MSEIVNQSWTRTNLNKSIFETKQTKSYIIFVDQTHFYAAGGDFQHWRCGVCRFRCVDTIFFLFLSFFIFATNFFFFFFFSFTEMNVFYCKLCLRIHTSIPTEPISIIMHFISYSRTILCLSLLLIRTNNMWFCVQQMYCICRYMSSYQLISTNVWFDSAQCYTYRYLGISCNVVKIQIWDK